MKESINVTDIALSFKNVGISSLFPPVPLLSNISGYVKKGGITAGNWHSFILKMSRYFFLLVMGASASGKSVLLRVLAGRLQMLSVTGEFLQNGVPMDPHDIRNKVSFVPSGDFLMGELTPRETLRNIALMKKTSSRAGIEREINNLLERFGLTSVADNIIGTVFVRSLSGGQKKRVEVCSELVAPHSILLLDEPTSGLDGSTAFDVLHVIRNLLDSMNGKLSIILSIHQPNTRILQLFDHILLLGGGGMLYFGTVPDSVDYFTSIGFPPPEQFTPTDVFLQVSDSNFGSNHDFDFEGCFACSKYAFRLKCFLNELRRNGVSMALRAEIEKEILHEQPHSQRAAERTVVKVQPSGFHVREEDQKLQEKPIKFSFWRQYITLLHRDIILASRDPSLYYLQFVLVTMFGFLVGACFFRLKIEIGSRMDNIPASLLWIVMMMCYIQVFKVYHLNRANDRFKHEITNNTYGSFVYWLAETTATGLLLSSFIPGTVVAYFMMDLPSKAYPFLIFLFWLSAFTAETMLNFISKFSEDATVSIVSSQAVLVILTVFGGGAFIPWNKCPVYWKWLQEISLFTQASRSAIMNVNDYLTYSCTLAADDQCYGPLGNIFPCDVTPPINGTCEVSGRMVLYISQGTGLSESKWVPFAYLALIFVLFRFATLYLLHTPFEKLKFRIQNWFSGYSSRGILNAFGGLRRVEGQLNAFISTNKIGDEEEEFLLERILPDGDLDDKNTNYINVDELFSQNYDAYNFFPPVGHVLVWKNLSVTLPKSGQILIDNVSGIALPGRLLALMGPSGAGKTTLLNALSNRAPYAKVEGDIMFGKRNFTPLDLVYVPQFDEFNQNLTVFEQIDFIGSMKCHNRTEMRERLGHLMVILGLSDKIHTLCKDLTSGELKRVSVGMGMISNPNVLFLDEPTTGLDSTAAYSIVKYLSGLSTATNVVIVMTIHQPAQIVFHMLEDLYLMEGGRLAYFGPLKATSRYFSSMGYFCPVDINPADFYLDVIHTSRIIDDTTPTWQDQFINSIFYKNYSTLLNICIAKSKHAGMPDQPPKPHMRIHLLLKFFWRYYWRDNGFYYLRLVFLIVVAFFIGTLFLRLSPKISLIPQYSGAIFFNIWTTLFSAVAATGLLAADRRQAVEQVKNGVMCPEAYCLAQFIVSVPFNLVVSIVYQAIFHWLIDLNPIFETFIYGIVITVGHLLLMEAIMLTVVAILKNAMLSVTFAMVVLGYLFLFSGFFVHTDATPVWIGWISYITPTMYSFDGYLWQVFNHQNFDAGSNGSVSGSYILDTSFNLKNIDSWAMFGILMGWTILFRFAHYFIFFLEVRSYLNKPTDYSGTNHGSDNGFTL